MQNILHKGRYTILEMGRLNTKSGDIGVAVKSMKGKKNNFTNVFLAVYPVQLYVSSLTLFRNVFKFHGYL